MFYGFSFFKMMPPGDESWVLQGNRRASHNLFKMLCFSLPARDWMQAVRNQPQLLAGSCGLFENLFP